MGRVPSRIAATATPGASTPPAPRKARAGSDVTETRPGHLQDTGLLGRPEPVLAPRSRRARHIGRLPGPTPRPPGVQRPSPRQTTSFVTSPTGPRVCRARATRRRGARQLRATCPTEPARPSSPSASASRPIDHEQAPQESFRRGKDRVEVLARPAPGTAPRTHRRPAPAGQPGGATRPRLLPGRVQHVGAAVATRCRVPDRAAARPRRYEHQGGLADTVRHQDHQRPRHQSPTQDPVDLSDADASAVRTAEPPHPARRRDSLPTKPATNEPIPRVVRDRARVTVSTSKLHIQHTRRANPQPRPAPRTWQT